MKNLYLRSINIQYDGESPERIGHFRPTTKSVSLIRSLIGLDDDAATLVIAPYGTGKSIAATYALHLAENKRSARKVLSSIGTRLRQINPELSNFAQKRINGSHQGLVLALQGYASDLPQTLHQAAVVGLKRIGRDALAKRLARHDASTFDAVIEALVEIRNTSQSVHIDRMLIIWDEFGKHLENVVSQGRTVELFHLQSLAEFVSRSTKIPVTLGLLLHQSMLHYAGSAPQTLRQELAKIEGRFKHLQYIDDSKEVYALIGDIFEGGAKSSLSETDALNEARAARAAGFFTDFTTTELADLLRRVYPVEATTLYLLPRVSSRIAQNERTLFNFLSSVRVESPITPGVLYDYFAPLMRGDITAGGTHRHWLETESALNKVQDDERMIEAIKIVCLLSLGISGERGRASVAQVRFACRGYKARPVDDVFSVLLRRKLLLHRKSNDEYTLWHGTDADLQGRLADERGREGTYFNLCAFLEKEAPPPVWRPVEHNSIYGIQRFLNGFYMLPEDLSELAAKPEKIAEFLSRSPDGIILYVLLNSHTASAQCEHAISALASHDRVIVVIPREPISLREASVEVHCLVRMQQDKALIGEDPLILPELKQMTDDAREHLQQVLDKVVVPSACNSKWYYEGKEFVATSARELRSQLSRIMKMVFTKTPTIQNELIVRQSPSPIIVNARKKLMMGILERSGKERLGLVGNFPDSSIFRTVLLHTGLYAQQAGQWRYMPPESVADEGMQAVWRKFHSFFTEAGQDGKSFARLFDELQAPPYGLRMGVIPVLLAAGLVAFSGAVALRRKGVYVRDILPSEVESIIQDPETYSLAVLNLDKREEQYLRDFHLLFHTVRDQEVPASDLIRLCYDSLKAWASQLPRAALNTRSISQGAIEFRDLLVADSDPVRLLMNEIPRLAGCELHSTEKILKAVSGWKVALEELVNIFVDKAGAIILKTLSLEHESGHSVRDAVDRWACCLSDAFVKGDYLQGIPKGLLARLKTKYDSDTLLVDSIASMLLGKPTAAWDDSTHVAFERELQAAIRKIEEVALNVADVAIDGDNTLKGLVSLADARIREMVIRIRRLAGDDKTTELLKMLLKDVKCGNVTSGA